MKNVLRLFVFIPQGEGIQLKTWRIVYIYLVKMLQSGYKIIKYQKKQALKCKHNSIVFSALSLIVGHNMILLYI